MNIREQNSHLRRHRGRPPSPLTLGAQALGCSYAHLHQVVHGKRTSPELLQSFKDWAQAQQAEGGSLKAAAIKLLKQHGAHPGDGATADQIADQIEALPPPERRFSNLTMDQFGDFIFA